MTTATESARQTLYALELRCITPLTWLARRLEVRGVAILQGGESGRSPLAAGSCHPGCSEERGGRI